MDSFYREHILDHYHEPRFHGRIEDATASYEDSNPLCGDVIRIDLRIEGGKVVDARFDGSGCAVSQASASMLLEAIVGMPVDEVRAFSRDELFGLIGVTLSPARMKCALLSLGVLKAGLNAAAPAGPTTGGPE